MVDGCDGNDGPDGHQIERSGVNGVLGYDYPGKMSHKIDGEHPEGLPSLEGWWAALASMAWLAQGSTEVEVPLVLGGVE